MNYSVGTSFIIGFAVKKVVSEYPRLKILTCAHHIMVHSRRDLLIDNATHTTAFFVEYMRYYSLHITLVQKQ